MFLDMIRRVKADCRAGDIGLSANRESISEPRLEADGKHAPLRHQCQNAYTRRCVSGASSSSDQRDVRATWTARLH